MNTEQTIEEARAAHIAERETSLQETQHAVDLRTLEAADLFRANVGHLAGFALVMISKANDALVATDGEVVDGLSALAGNDRTTVLIVKNYLTVGVAENDGNPHRGKQPTNLEDLLAQIIGRS